MAEIIWKVRERQTYAAGLPLLDSVTELAELSLPLQDSHIIYFSSSPSMFIPVRIQSLLPIFLEFPESLLSYGVLVMCWFLTFCTSRQGEAQPLQKLHRKPTNNHLFVSLVVGIPVDLWMCLEAPMPSCPLFVPHPSFSPFHSCFSFVTVSGVSCYFSIMESKSAHFSLSEISITGSIATIMRNAGAATEVRFIGFTRLLTTCWVCDIEQVA